jgi:hypothetical protein
MDMSGYSEYFDHIHDESSDMFDFAPKDNLTREWQEGASNMCHAYEMLQDQEDEDMMIRLIKIRKTLWT